MKVNKLQSIAIFCGSNTGYQPVYRNAVKELAQILADKDITLIYGGAKVGLMGVIADTILGYGGKVIGVIPQSLVDVEVAHLGLTDLHIVNSMHQRKALIAELAECFILLPGGSGSLDEFFEIFTWSQLGYHAKPCGILNIHNYYDQLIRFLDHSVTEGFLKAEHRDQILVDESPTQLLHKFANYTKPIISKWITDEALYIKTKDFKCA